jgi:hypothetical protein
MDESGCDKWIGFKHTGWDSFGVTLVKIAWFHGSSGAILDFFILSGLGHACFFDWTYISVLTEISLLKPNFCASEYMRRLSPWTKL